MLLDDSLLTTLHVSDIKPHPDNPRKDLGDLEELEESIKKNGIMQNLTVVPVDEDNPDKYICLIGHRRLAAAKAAGLYQVPARIVFGLSHKDQVGIMLEENMQRNDLTIVEQAQGFQMMLDLGETEETIAEKTGFSRTTVHHRLQLAKLDQTELKRRQDDEGFQLSLKDLYALEKVKDINKRNEILKKAFSSNEIRRQAENAERDEKRELTAAAIIKQLPIEAKPIPKSENNWRWSGKYETIAEIDLDNPKKEITLDLEDGEIPRYGITYTSLYIMVPKRKTKREEEVAEKQKDIARRRKEMSKLQKQLEEERRMFVRGIIEGKYKKPDDLDQINKMLWAIALDKYASINWSGFYTFLTGAEAYGLSDEEMEKEKDRLRNIDPRDLMLIAVTRAYEGFALIDWHAKAMPETMEQLKGFYNILRMYGYQLSDDERKVLAGTHELYIREDA